MNKKIKKLLFIVIAVLVVLLVISGIIWGVAKAKKPAFLYNALMAGKSATYSLVYVQVGSGTATYYGQIVKEDKETIVMKNPGYIEIADPTSENEQAQISFHFMKDDFLKPLSEIKIYKQKIIFTQDLSEESPIVNTYENVK
ncbi:MAG: hypothetical protein WC523_07035 [Patescibacteria group bacterium]